MDYNNEIEKKQSIEINGKVENVSNCPFCGGESYINIRRFTECWGMGEWFPATAIRIACDVCGCSTPEYKGSDSYEKALKVWNTRV